MSTSFLPKPSDPASQPAEPQAKLPAGQRTLSKLQLQQAIIKHALRVAVAETLYPVALGLGLLYLVFSIAHRFTLPSTLQPYMMATAFSSMLGLLALALRVRRQPVDDRYVHPLSALIAGFVLLNSLLHMLLTRDPMQSSNFMLLLVGVGFFLLSSRWFAGALVVIFSCWGAAMSQVTNNAETITHFCFGLLSAAVLATLLHYARKRMLTRLTLLRLQDEERAAHLQVALEAERESEVALRQSEANYRQLNQELAIRAQDLHLLNQQLAKASQLKDEFLASMSHELRTPLTAILGLTESLQEQVYGPLNDRQAVALHNVEESGRHLLTLINDVLDVAKTEAGKLAIQLTPTDVAMICEVSLRMVRQDALHKGITLISQLDPQLSLFLADERRLKQMLVNLLSNAIKFSPDGSEVGLLVSGDPAAELIRFTVWDRGIGIAEADLERLFKPFVQLDSKLARRYAGTGLGLVLVYRMAEIHGGSIQVESKPQQGSRFTVTLPWRKVARTDDGKLINAAPAPSMALPAPRAARQVLVIDEHEFSSAWLTSQIAQCGYAVHPVHNRTDALNWLATNQPALILADIDPAQNDGVEWLLALRSCANSELIPLVAMSALDLPGHAQRYYTAGATHYSVKPVAQTLLLTLLDLTTISDHPMLAKVQGL